MGGAVVGVVVFVGVDLGSRGVGRGVDGYPHFRDGCVVVVVVVVGVGIVVRVILVLLVLCLGVVDVSGGGCLGAAWRSGGVEKKRSGGGLDDRSICGWMTYVGLAELGAVGSDIMGVKG